MSSGLDKIISQIGQEASETSARIIREAQEKAKEIHRDSDAQIAQIEADTEAKCAALKADILKKSSSAAKMQRRRELLAAKQEMIDEVIKEAGDSLYNLSDAEYFSLLKEILSKHVTGEKGEICFNQKDFARLPEDFMVSARQIAAAKGGSLTLSDKPREIDGGFVLVYGGIEENCSFASAFEGAKERLTDTLHEMLFAQ